ncbi:MAG TPA: helix-turn-helix domain-containing protein [Burkholderiaceae bacterium]
MGPAIRLHDVAPQRNRVIHLAAARAGQAGTLSDLLQLMGAGADDLAGAAGVPIPMRFLHAGETLFHEGARAEAIYFVRAGTFKTFRTAEDGYEQVLGFAGRAELLGFDALCKDRHPTAAVALEDSNVYVVLARDIFSLGQRMPALDRVVHLAVSRALTHRGELADVMAAVAAEVRLARFLVQLPQPMAECGQAPHRFHLRMSRRDIASHLGVAHETVSRSFTALADWGFVRVDNREVDILDLDALKELSRSTRRQVDEPVRAHAPRLAMRSDVRARAS